MIETAVKTSAIDIEPLMSMRSPDTVLPAPNESNSHSEGFASPEVCRVSRLNHLIPPPAPSCHTQRTYSPSQRCGPQMPHQEHQPGACLGGLHSERTPA